MPAIPANPGTFHWNAPRPHRGGTFRPNGRIEYHGVRRNPETWSSSDTLAGRIIVGFNVGPTPTYTVDDLIPIVDEVRTRQVGNPPSSFIAQKGIYQHHDGKTVVHEDGAQVIIIDLSGGTEEEFQAQMIELAEIIAQRLQQETVIVEIQKNGISQRTIGVGP